MPAIDKLFFKSECYLLTVSVPIFLDLSLLGYIVVE